MKAALIGLPQSGKTTLASAITGHSVDPRDAGRIQHAVVKVPDRRLEILAGMYNPKKVVEATLEFIDVPGFSLADHKGQEDLKRYLPELRQSDLLVAVVRAFENPAVPAYRDRVDPAADVVELREELVYADLVTIENRIEKVEKALKKPTKDHDREKREHALLLTCNDALENARPLSSVITTDDDRKAIASFALLTLKPLLVVFNISEQDAIRPDPEVPEHTAGAVDICVVTEAEIAQLDPEDQAAFLSDLGVDQPARDRLVRKSYQTIGLVSFLTVGPDEVRAWSVPVDGTAVEAAGKIHSDMARGFIRAETVAYDDLIEAGDIKTAKANAKVRQEGKTYVVRDGDVINFKFNL